SNEAYTLTQQRFRPIGVATPDASWNIPACAASGEGRQCLLLEGSTGAMPALVGTAPWVSGNAGGAGYYRFDLPEADWDRLIAAGPTVPGAEALTVVDSLWAGFSAGTAGFDRQLAAARAFAPHSERLVATFLPAEISAFVSRAGTPADMEAAGRFVRDLALPRLAVLGLDPGRGAYKAEAPDRRQLRQSLTALAVVNGRAPAQSALLALAARKSLSGDLEALDSAYRTVALRAALRDDSELTGKLFEAMATSDDTLFRRHAAGALGAEASPAILDRIADRRVQNLEALGILATQMREPDTRDAALGWLEANLDVLKPRLGGLLGGFIGVTANFCTEDAAARVEKLFRPRMAELGIGDLDLARPVATIRQCVAVKAKRGAEVSAALAKAG
ncbi:MAG: ERAP1-like C-terminal domain-containing protein, partial [Sandaracinobacteroides sp.]